MALPHPLGQNPHKGLINRFGSFAGVLEADPCDVHPRHVVEAALHHRAASVVLAHNHPTGEPKPSRHDHKLTQTLIPEDVRSKISQWSDYIDYWAIDWNYRHDTFMNQWQTYRTRKQRKLELVSSAYSYEEPGPYNILIKVVDIFGNDTSRLLEWKVKK